MLSSIHLAATSSISFFGPGDVRALYSGGSVQEAKRLQQSRMIEAVVMLAIGLSMASVVLGNLNNDDSV